MEDVKLKNVSLSSAQDALDCVKMFSLDYPDRKGFSAGVVYSKAGSQTFYVYRTKTSLVAAGQ